MSNPNQEIIEARLASYVDGELEDAGERLEIEQHLQQNPQYRRMLEDLRQQRDMLRGLPREAAPTDLGDALNGQLERSVLLDSGPGDGDRSRMRIPAFPRMFAAAAIVLLTVGLAAILFFVLPNRNSQTVTLAPVSPVPVAPSADRNTSMPEDEPTDGLPGNADEKDAAVPAPLSPPEALGAAPPPPASVAMLDDRAARNRALAEDKAVSKDATEQLQLGAKRMATYRVDTLSRGEAPRDAELEELAKNVSQDPHVRNMLVGGLGANVQANSQPASSNNAVVMVVRAGDVKQVQEQLGRFFSQSNVAWQPAPRTVELALNTSLSQHDGEALPKSATAGEREIEPEALEGNNEVLKRKKQAALVDAAGTGQIAQAPPPAPASPSAPPAAPTLGPAAIKPGDGSSLKESPAKAAAKSNTAESQLGENASDSYRAASLPSDLSRARRQDDFAANATPVNNLYVARHLSRRQAQELTDCLTRAGEVRKAGIALQPTEVQYDYNNAPASNNGEAKGTSSNGVPSAPGAQTTEKAREESRGGVQAGGSPSPAPVPNGPLALRTAGQAKASDQQNAGRDGSINKLDAAAPGSPEQGAVAARKDERRAVGAASVAKPQAAFGGAIPTTQPALGADDDADGLVDVVIVVQNDSASSNGMITEPAMQAAPATTPAPPPATQPTIQIPAPVRTPAK